MNETVITSAIDFVKERLSDAEAGHDWFHTQRVWKLARRIALTEPSADIFAVELGALLHDIADEKFHSQGEQFALSLATDFLTKNRVERTTVNKVLFIIRHISFKNRGELTGTLPIELQIVQDADRLDAIGAIGVARTFNFGGFRNNRMYDPSLKPLAFDKETYKKSNGTTINHFYEKLLLLKDMMNTSEGKKLAEERHTYMEEFLDRFLAEWEGQV